MLQKTIIYLLFFSSHIYSQEIIQINISDNESKNPVYASALTVDNVFLGYTDDFGNFEIDINQYSLESEVCFSHISYSKKCIKLKELITHPFIYLSFKHNELEEVVVTYISNTLSTKAVLKEAKKHFRNSLDVRKSYWSKINLKQCSFLKDSLQNYIEIDGDIFMNDNLQPRYIFSTDIIIPNHVRRTQEKLAFQKINYKQKQKIGVEQLSAHLVGYDILFAIRVLTRLHPLGEKSKKFKFNFVKEDIIEGENCYVIEYSRIEGINIKGRTFKKFYGKLWVNKEDYSLVKEKSSHHFEDLASNTMNVRYTTINNIVYPIKVESSAHHSKTRISSKSILTFNKINSKPQKFYEVNGTGISFRLKQFPYEKEYWEKQSFDLNPFKEELNEMLENENYHDAFTKGNNSLIYIKNHKKGKVLDDLYLTIWNKMNLMKNEASQ